MQTKKRISGRNASREHGCSRVSRSQKKASENVKIAEKKVTELITSSVRKQRCGASENQKDEATVVSKLTDRCDMVNNEVSNIPSWCNAMDVENSVESDTQSERGAIFSPPFHSAKISGAETASTEDALDSHGDSSEGNGLSSEVSAIYLAMKNSKLECVNENGHDYDSIQTNAYVEEDESEDFDDFDPYLFIKNLPELSAVVPTYRRMLLPRQTRSCPRTTLVLDLDETLVHSSLEPCDDADFTFPVDFNLQQHIVYVRCRPHLYDFMKRVSDLFEIIIFTASQSIYAEQLLNVLDPKRKVFRHRVYRESCVFVDGNYLKDLSVLGRDLARVVIVDNSPQAFGFQVDNGIPIESWFDDPSDKELLLLLPFLESLVGVEDVRPLIAKKYNLREKIAAAIGPPLYPGNIEMT